MTLQETVDYYGNAIREARNNYASLVPSLSDPNFLELSTSGALQEAAAIRESLNEEASAAVLERALEEGVGLVQDGKVFSFGNDDINQIIYKEGINDGSIDYRELSGRDTGYITPQSTSFRPRDLAATLGAFVFAGPLAAQFGSLGGAALNSLGTQFVTTGQIDPNRLVSDAITGGYLSDVLNGLPGLGGKNAIAAGLKSGVTDAVVQGITTGEVDLQQTLQAGLAGGGTYAFKDFMRDALAYKTPERLQQLLGVDAETLKGYDPDQLKALQTEVGNRLGLDVEAAKRLVDYGTGMTKFADFGGLLGKDGFLSQVTGVDFDDLDISGVQDAVRAVSDLIPTSVLDGLKEVTGNAIPWDDWTDEERAAYLLGEYDERFFDFITPRGDAELIGITNLDDLSASFADSSLYSADTGNGGILGNLFGFAGEINGGQITLPGSDVGTTSGWDRALDALTSDVVLPSFEVPEFVPDPVEEEVISDIDEDTTLDLAEEDPLGDTTADLVPEVPPVEEPVIEEPDVNDTPITDSVLSPIDPIWEQIDDNRNNPQLPPPRPPEVVDLTEPPLPDGPPMGPGPDLGPPSGLPDGQQVVPDITGGDGEPVLPPVDVQDEPPVVLPPTVPASPPAPTTTTTTTTSPGGIPRPGRKPRSGPEDDVFKLARVMNVDPSGSLQNTESMFNVLAGRSQGNAAGDITGQVDPQTRAYVQQMKRLEAERLRQKGLFEAIADPMTVIQNPIGLG